MARRASLFAWLVWGACAGLGCKEAELETLSTQLTLRYVPGCAPRSLDALVVEALGDFSAASNTLVSFDPEQGTGTLRGFPVEARQFRMTLNTADFHGAALLALSEAAAPELALMLPLGRACALPDLELRAPEGAAWAVSQHGELFAVGGARDTGEATGSVLRSSVEAQREVETPDTLFVARAGAAALAVGNEVWVLGGAQNLAPGTQGLSNFERIDAQGRAAGVGRLVAPRVGGQALRFSDGSVLVLGGARSVDGDLLRSLERLAPGAERAEELSAELPWQGVLSSAVLRDDGLVALTGWADAEPQLALFDPQTGSMQLVAGPEDAWDPELVLALPGARLAFLERRDGATTGVLWLRLMDGAYVRVSRWLASFAGLRDASASVLMDGRILLTGSAPTGPMARILDVGRGDVRLRELPFVPRLLLSRADGSVLGIGDAGVWVFREDARSVYDNPAGTLLADDTADRSVLALAAPEQFEREGLGLIATQAGARFDLAGLRYQDVLLEAQVQGSAELRLRTEFGAEVVLELGEARVGTADCGLDGDPKQPVTLRRSGQALTLGTSRGQEQCTLAELEGPLSVAFVAREADVHIEDLRITRE